MHGCVLYCGTDRLTVHCVFVVFVLVWQCGVLCVCGGMMYVHVRDTVRVAVYRVRVRVRARVAVRCIVCLWWYAVRSCA